uniref:LIM and calponin homology domains-containing protein 1-like n=1 Tax=Myxine glutinosa TaxID=7769 RepID=UPI00358FF4CF
MESPLRKKDLHTASEHDEDDNSDKEECDVGEICRDGCESHGSMSISEGRVRKSEEDLREGPAVLTAEAEALYWLQAVTGKKIETDNIRDALQDGVLLCELINILHPGCVWKINRRASPIAGLDNLGAFLRGCASLGLKVSQ